MLGPAGGTVALAAMTLAALLTTIVITTQDRMSARTQLEKERTAADDRAQRQIQTVVDQVAAERESADARLSRQIHASSEQLERQRRAADERLTAELREIREREQLAEAYAVQVEVAAMPAGPATSNVQKPVSSSIQSIAIMVVNRGRYAITDINAQLSCDGRSLIGAPSPGARPGSCLGPACDLRHYG